MCPSVLGMRSVSATGMLGKIRDVELTIGYGDSECLGRLGDVELTVGYGDND